MYNRNNYLIYLKLKGLSPPHLGKLRHRVSIFPRVVFMTKLPHPTEKKKLFSSFSFKWAKPQEFLLFGLDLELSCPYFPIYHFPLSTFITSPEFSRRLRVSAKHLESLIINPSAAPSIRLEDFQVFPLYKVWERKKTPIAAVTPNLSLHTGGKSQRIATSAKVSETFFQWD